MTRRAVVFAYHNVGARCLRVLLAGGVEVALVVTHEDDPNETIWFDSVATVAAEHGIETITPGPAEVASLEQRVAALAPDFVFSFYYRLMLPTRLLGLAPRGAFNMHGSLLPRYRGRAPVNWAVLHGEGETGATLHEMVEKPDAGAIVAQTAVPILPDDTAHQVFEKVTVAAEITLWRALPGLLDGSAPRLPNDLAAGSYFGGRRPDDGRLDFSQSAQRVYDLIRAVAPPYPGAFADIATSAGVRRVIVARARLTPLPPALAGRTDLPAGFLLVDNALLAVCGDGRAIAIHELRTPDGERIDRDAAHALFPSFRT
ncbi:formyltransferase [Chitinasiproducens palmae]|uniref:Methionyl-tRNA formyltransferase n=1 Tax=Chitinasiproducens palmae TaxID=1770053 RepID=A0A1H2PM73_9BURK|nr:formyltransferase [Chitinasiproducens palmae]SDV47538.1 methionyl-tRNA formyltransferase [Chitinasiproducens palmae]